MRNFEELEQKLKLEKRKTWILALSIFVIGFSIRYLAHGPRLAALDPWFQYMMAKYVVFEGGVPQNYPLAYYPTGRNPWIQDALFLPYFIGYTFKYFVYPLVSIAPLSGLLGISGLPESEVLMKYMIVFPALLGGLSCISLYLVTKEIFSKRIALVAALIYTSIPAAVSRVWAGFCDKESLASFLIYLSLYLFLKSYKSDPDVKKMSIYAVATGLTFFAAVATWSGGELIAILIFVSTVPYFLLKKDTSILIPTTIMTPLGMLLLWLFQAERYPLKGSILGRANFVGIVAITTLSLIFFSTRYLHSKSDKKLSEGKIYTAFLAILIASILAFQLQDAVLNLPRMVLNLFGNILSTRYTDIYMPTVAESQPTHFFGGGNTIIQKFMAGDWFGYLNMTIILVPFGIFFILRKMRESLEYSHFLALVWVVGAVLAMRIGQRFNFFLAAPSAMFTSYVLIAPFDSAKKRIKDIQNRFDKTKKQKSRYRMETELTNLTYRRYILLFLVLFITFSVMIKGVQSLEGRRSDVPAPWYEAMMWLKDNTPENSVIWSWWDYGYWFQAVAERYSVADGGGNVIRNIDLAHMFTVPENESMEYIEKYVDYEKVPSYMLVSYEEFGKSGAINHIAQDDLIISQFGVPNSGNPEQDYEQISQILSQNGLNSFYIVNYGDHYQIWVLLDQRNPEMKDKLLARLLPFNTGAPTGNELSHFKLVYSDPKYRYIYIYRIV